MRREFSTKDSVSSYHPSYDADFYDLRPKAKRAEGALRPQLQVTVRQDTKESLKKEALDRLRHVSEYRILQTGFVRVGKYICLGAVLPPYFLLVRLPQLLVGLGSQTLQQIWKTVRLKGKNWADRAAKMRQSVQLPEILARLLKSVGRAPASAWGYCKEQSRMFFQNLFSKMYWPNIRLPSWPTGWKMNFWRSKKIRWPQWKWGSLPKFSRKTDFFLNTRLSYLSKHMQAGWKNAFLQAQDYVKQVSVMAKEMLQKAWENRWAFLKKRAQSRGSEKQKAPKSAAAIRTALQKIQEWGYFSIEGWKWLLLACAAFCRFFIQWIVWLGRMLWDKLPRFHIKKPSGLQYPQLQWPAWTFSLSDVSLPTWKYTWRQVSLPPFLLKRWKENRKTLSYTKHLTGMYLKGGAHLMLLSFFMSCIVIVWAIQAIDQTCSKNGLRDLCLPFFDKR